VKALILAAGLGSRLGEKTETLPKALVPVRGEPILSWQMKALLQQGIGPIGIVVGHCGEKIVSFVRELFPTAAVSFIWNRDYRESNSSWSFWLARPWIGEESYLHLNCDVLFSHDLLRRLLSSPQPNLIAVRLDVPMGGRLEHVALEGDRIVEMSITRTPRSVGKAFGLAKFGTQSTRFLEGRLRHYLEAGDRMLNCFGLVREAVSILDYRALIANSRDLLEINTLEEWREANEDLS